MKLAHYTIKDYLRRTVDKWFPGADGYVAQGCVECIWSGILMVDVAEGLFEYAMQNQDYDDPYKLQGVDDEPDSFTMADKTNPYNPESVYCNTKIIRVHLAACFGIRDVLFDLQSRDIDLDAPDNGGNTPLIQAVKQGHEDFALGL